MLGKPYFEFDYYPLPEIAPDYRYTSLFNVDFSTIGHTVVSVSQAHMFAVTNADMEVLLH